MGLLNWTRDCRPGDINLILEPDVSMRMDASGIGKLR